MKYFKFNFNKKNITIIFMIFLFIILLVYLFYLIQKNHTADHFYTQKTDAPEDDRDDNIVLLISHYNEDLSYLDNAPFNRHKQIIYTKGTNPPNCKQCNSVKQLPNVGVNVHTYLHYIIENYDHLPDVTVFLSGSCTEAYKMHNTLKTIEMAEKTKNSVFIVIEQPLDTPKLNHFTLDTYHVANSSNRDLNNDQKMNQSNVRPFGEWFKTYFGDIDFKHWNHFAIFAVSRHHIHNRSKESYQQWIELVNKDKNEESAHFFERAFLYVFHPIPESCLIIEPNTYV